MLHVIKGKMNKIKFCHCMQQLLALNLELQATTLIFEKFLKVRKRERRRRRMGYSTFLISNQKKFFFSAAASKERGNPDQTRRGNAKGGMRIRPSQTFGCKNIAEKKLPNTRLIFNLNLNPTIAGKIQSIFLYQCF